MRRIESVFLLIAVASQWTCCLSKPPNIIFILSDDLGYGDVSISAMVNRTNEIPTPNIQRLADEGMRFLRGYSGQVCAPSRCTLMTGKHLGHCRVRGNDGSYCPLLPSETTVAHVLREKYTTGIVGKWGLGDFNTTGYPLEQGFDHYIGQASQVACHNWYPATMQNNTLGNYPIAGNEHASQANCGEHHSKCTWANDLFNREAIRFIRENGQASVEKPFFLYFSTTTPHTGFLAGAKTSWAVPAPYDTRFHFDTVESAFAAATSAQDDFVGAVLDEVKSLGIDQDTIVFFSGDNGPDSHPFTFFDDPGPFRGKKRSLHEGGVRQTITARWPGHIAANSTTEHLFAFWDFLPTAAELAGVDVPDNVDGISAAAVLQGQTAQKQHDYLYWEFCNYGREDGLLPQQYEPGWIQAVRYDAVDAAGVRTEWKGIRTAYGEIQLYNLTDDISESVNVSTKYPDIVTKITSIMAESHVENPYWKSSKNMSDRCCASCFNHKGCKYPCVQINTTAEVESVYDAHYPELSEPLLYLSPYYLLGDWLQADYDTGVDVEKRDSEFRIHIDSSGIAMHVDSPTDACIHKARIDLHPDDTNSYQQAMLSQTNASASCRKLSTGKLHTDGSSLFIVWREPRGPIDNQNPVASIWKKPHFDFD
ncbi:arylsulfatase F-like [Sycon ciliatum]|uniref:arylsulfatase F-like n=1 Tax=Sycon ciliatum TaxID=27933 RepID=UPI0031F6CF81